LKPTRYRARVRNPQKYAVANQNGGISKAMHLKSSFPDILRKHANTNKNIDDSKDNSEKNKNKSGI